MINLQKQLRFLKATRFFALALFSLISGTQVLLAQYRPGGAGGGATPSGDIGRITIELPMKSPVYTATVQIYFGEQQVATRSMKKDSVGDRSRMADIRNLKEGLYTLKIESPGLPDMLSQVFVRNEKDPVRVFIDYPESMIPQKPEELSATSGGMNELLLRIERLEEKITVLEKKGGVKTSSKRSRRAPAKKEPPVEASASPESQTDGQPAVDDPLQDPTPVKVTKGKKKKPVKANTRNKPQAAADSTVNSIPE